ncbi:hypothetical protein V5T82_05315 [Magnetovibrio sp. PR-2]|uniref:hypothetical protein n=1 Tax=Magnetovibrio sp. PR-2 TaxID=3120356 RepID=UPI002FCE37B7
MALYTFDQRSFVGVEHIDEAHRQIAALSQALKDLIEEGASFDEVHKTFLELSNVMKDHFT